MANEVIKENYVHNSDVAIYATADWSKVVAPDSPDAVYLLARPGDIVEYDSAVRLGLIKPKVAKASSASTSSDTNAPKV